MSFPKYPKYKDSGVEWLGEVPEHWDVRSFRHCLSELFNGLTSTQVDETDLTVPVTRIETISTGIIDESRLGFINPEDARDDRMLRAGDILFSNINSLNMIGNCAIYLGGRVIFAGMNLLVLRPANGNAPRWLYWLIRSTTFREVVESLAKPAINQASISQSSINSIAVPVPLHDEQTAIASFLNQETAKIDVLIAEQRRLIELLKEKRQAVISHAVTKGLNPNVPLKPSGIEWLGDVPEHWDLGKVKHYFSTCSGGTPSTVQQSMYYADESSGCPWVRTTDLNNDFLRSVPVFITEQAIKDTACSILPVGTVLVAMYGGDGTVGKNSLLMFPAAINQAVCGLLPSRTHDSEFVFRYMQFYRPYWMIGAESSRKDPNISQDRVKNAPFPQPPIDEQREIVAFINQMLDAYNGLLLEAIRAIALLQERRTALISAAVTGKIDVRSFAPQIPEVA
jgi:type I restriction enzyme S subunit